MASPRLPSLPKSLKVRQPEVEFVNLTPHAINYFYNEKDYVVIHESGIVARIIFSKKTCTEVGHFKMYKIGSAGTVVDVPPPKQNTFYIVSGHCKMLLRNRPDVVCPVHVIKGANGSVFGCMGFAS